MIKQLAEMEAGGGFCPECGPVFFDEDGQCVNCGAMACGGAIDELVYAAVDITKEMTSVKAKLDLLESQISEAIRISKLGNLSEVQSWLMQAGIK